MSPTEESGKRAAEGLKLGGLAVLQGWLLLGLVFLSNAALVEASVPLPLQHQRQRLPGRIDLGL